MNQTLTTLQRQGDAAALVPAPAGGVEIAQSRVAQEVQAAMVVAKKFPRDEPAALARIEKACCRPRLAELSQYHFPRGKEEISGPTIRLAEVLAQGWGNLDYGTIEIEQRPGESLMMAYCWDLETNLRSTMLFVVPHVREKKSGNALTQIALEGARDIYEVTANMAARRKRACILNVIPRDVQDLAIDLCNQTLAADFNDEKRDKMIAAFQNDFGVTVEQLEAFIGRRAPKFDGGTYIRLRRVYATLKDGFAQVADFFPPPASTEGKPRSKFGFAKPEGDATATNQWHCTACGHVFDPATAKTRKKGKETWRFCPQCESPDTEPLPSTPAGSEMPTDATDEAKEGGREAAPVGPFVCTRCDRSFPAMTSSGKCGVCMGTLREVTPADA